ncbi:MAG: hypothetical protein H7311_04880, partial [Ramlibacter sp.]|nr:hypothetical protein [Cryobacterium sp.]
IDLPDSAREDPTWFRTNGERYGRDGCRVPLPWEADAPSYGFGPSALSWLPQPDSWAGLARDAQVGVAGSTLELNPQARGLRRARAASTLMLALPGSSYLYQGEELGLHEIVDLPDSAREDPTWFRTNGERYGRDGCRVPLPWEADAPSYGFGPSALSWLPQPDSWAGLARDAQVGVAGSTLELYTLALRLRRELQLGLGSVRWLAGQGDEIVAFINGAVTVLANTSDASVPLPAGEVLLASGPLTGGLLPGDTTVWLRA